MMFWRAAIISVLGLINIALLCKAIWGPTGLMEYHALKAEYAALQEKIAILDTENMALSRDIRLMQSDPQYVEKMVRQKLHYLRDNEIVYIFANPGQNMEAKSYDGKN